MRSTINLARAAIVTVALTVVSVGTSVSAFGADFDAKFLHRVCKAGDAGDHWSYGYCLGVATGIFDMATYMKMVCPRKFTSYGVARDVMEKYLADHPEDGDAPAGAVTLVAFMSAWPCPAPQ